MAVRGEQEQPTAVVEILDRALDDLSGAGYNDWLFGRARPLLGQRVLDVGAGIGTFTALAAEDGREVTAVEPEHLFAEALRSRFAADTRVTVVEGTIDAVAGTFDSAISFNVLEHVADDAAVARSCAGRLVPGGRFFVLVPAHERLFGGYDRAAGHLRRYSATGLRRLLDGAGLEVDTLRHVNPVGAVGWAARVATTSSEEWPSGAFALFDRLVPVLRRLDWLPLPFGLSLWAVARKPVNGA
jgi:SAM-dependent methyltransferase